MKLLPRYEEAVIPIEKLVDYALNPKNSNGKHLAFEMALGYNLSNYQKLIDNIKSNIRNFPAVEHSDKGHGIRYSVVMELTGVNGRTARVVTAWIDDNKTGVMRLTSVYVKKRKGD